MSPRIRLILAAVAFVAWLSWLGYAALTKSRAPIVSHAQSAAADGAVVAEVKELAPTAFVEEKLWGDVPTAGRVEVMNLAEAKGFAGPGKYLLYLTRRGDRWAVVGPQRSPGSDLSNLVGPFLIYPWDDHVRKQAEALKP
jgi:hypothetical protein